MMRALGIASPIVIVVAVKTHEKQSSRKIGMCHLGQCGHAALLHFVRQLA